MQVFFGNEPDYLSGVFATTGRVLKRGAKTTGRVVGKGAKTSMRVTGKAVNAIVPLSPALAFVPGVGPAAAGGIAAAKAVSSLIPKKKKPGPTVQPKKSLVQTKFSVIKAPDSIRKSLIKKSGFLPGGKSPFPGINFPGLNIPGFPGGGGGGGAVAEVAAPQKSFIEKNWPLMAGGAAVLFLIMRKR